MIEPNILAFQNAAVLEVLADPAANDVTTIAALAKRFERDPDNFRKTLKRLQDDGLLQDPPLDGLTDAGRDQLAAFKRAVHGGERRKAQGRWPIDRLRRNPDNRVISRADVEGMADTIVAVGGILQPLVVSAPDAEGVRTIWIGERRWLASGLLLERGALPEELAQGLPFVERAADRGEAAVMTLIENGARQDLNPWQEAQQMRLAAEAKGLNATELARTIGRAKEGDRGGVRDVQVKLKVAREATPEAIAAYEADPSAPGAWEILRDSVSKPKPPSAPEQPAAVSPDDEPSSNMVEASGQGGPFLIGYTPGRPYGRRFDRHNPEAKIEDFAPAFDWTIPRDDQLDALIEPGSRETFLLPHPTPAAARYANGYPRAQIEIARIAGSYGWIYAAGYSTSGLAHHERLGWISARTEAFASRDTAIAAGVDLIADSLGRNSKWKLPVDIAAWLADPKPAGPFVVNGVDYLNAARAGEARRALGLEKTHANYGGGERRAPSAAADYDAQAAAEAAKEDAYGRPADDDPSGAIDVQAADGGDAAEKAEAEVRARAEGTLAQVRAFAEEDGLAKPFGGWRFRQLWSELSTAGPFVGAANGGSDDPDESGCIFDANDCVVAVVDVHGEGPDAEADAQAELIAYALNFACSQGAEGVGSRTLDWPTAPEGETPDAAVVRTGRILEHCLGDAATVAGDPAVLVETLRQFRAALSSIERRLELPAAGDGDQLLALGEDA